MFASKGTKLTLASGVWLCRLIPLWWASPVTRRNMAGQLSPAAVLCCLLLVSAVSAQDASEFGASHKSNFEALIDKVSKVGTACHLECILRPRPNPPPLPRPLALAKA